MSGRKPIIRKGSSGLKTTVRQLNSTNTTTRERRERRKKILRHRDMVFLFDPVVMRVLWKGPITNAINARGEAFPHEGYEPKYYSYRLSADRKYIKITYDDLIHDDDGVVIDGTLCASIILIPIGLNEVRVTYNIIRYVDGSPMEEERHHDPSKLDKLFIIEKIINYELKHGYTLVKEAYDIYESLNLPHNKNVVGLMTRNNIAAAMLVEEPSDAEGSFFAAPGAHLRRTRRNR
jgi:hypothetical protein